LLSPAAERRYLDEEVVVEKERETKEDGRYIIFYTFEGETEEEGKE
jgi:hypothetical protein